MNYSKNCITLILHVFIKYELLIYNLSFLKNILFINMQRYILNTILLILLIIFISLLADTIFVPSGLNCAELNRSLCPSNVCTHSPVATLHTRYDIRVLSPCLRRYDIRAIRAKLRRTHHHRCVCTHSPVATLHTRTVLSSLADTIFVPSGLNRSHTRCAPPMSAHTPLSPRSTRAQSFRHSPIRYSCHPG